MEYSNDNRANIGNLKKEIIDGGAFYEFVRFVKENENKDKLALCFRGNGNPKSVIIYFNNHIIWKLYINKNNKPCVSISFNHARYTKDWKKILQELISPKFEFYGNTNIRKIKNNNRSGKITYSYTIGDLFSSKEKYDREFVEGSYKLIKSIVDDYFNKNLDIDYFRREIEKENNISRHREYIEKIEQQKIYNEFNNCNNGLYVYDLEFAQRSIKGKIKHKNEPDMLGIVFKDNKPKDLAFIEIKSTESAVTDKNSGLKRHIEQMEKYLKDKDYIHNREIECKDIIELYKELKLHNAENISENLNYTNLSKKIIVILTGEATGYFKRNISRYSKNNKDKSLSNYLKGYDIKEDDKGRIIISKEF